MTSPAAALGQVGPGYRHEDKWVRPDERLALPGAHLKWYGIQLTPTPIDVAVQARARAFLQAEATGGRLAVEGDLGFVVLHECIDAYFFLLVCTWRNGNELWETVYGSAYDSFALVPQQSHHPVFCVWELGAVGHERAAWIRYLRSERDDDARAAYLADSFSGSV